MTDEAGAGCMLCGVAVWYGVNFHTRAEEEPEEGSEYLCERCHDEQSAPVGGVGPSPPAPVEYAIKADESFRRGEISNARDVIADESIRLRQAIWRESTAGALQEPGKAKAYRREARWAENAIKEAEEKIRRLEEVSQ